MMIDSFTVFLVGACIFLLLLVSLANKVRSNLKRRLILRRYAHTEQVGFALKEGETIMAVKQEQNTLCFMVGNHNKDEQEYE